MPRRSLKQDSFFDPEFVCPGCIEEGKMAWLLARHGAKIFPDWLFQGWRGESRLGRNAWPPIVLMTLVLLRFSEEKMSRRASCRRARTDMKWRAAMGIACDVDPPSEKTVRDFEKFLRGRHPESNVPRFFLFHEHVVRLCKQAGLLGDETLWVTDSTPMWCYGAVIDTVRLLGEGIAAVARRWAEANRTTVKAVATEWEVEWILAPSIKGSFDIDWKDKAARADVITELAHKAIEVVETVRAGVDEVRRGKRKKLLKLSRNLMTVIEQNLESDGESGLRVARRVAADRLISLTDSQARHGRKSSSKTFNGFKLHLLGDAISGLIVSLTVTAGNVHDSQPAHRLIRRAKTLCDSIKLVLADTAYGGVELRTRVEKCTGVKMLAPPIQSTPRRELGKAAFDIDLEEGTAICPNGVVSRDLKYVWYSSNEKQAPRFLWPREKCQDCPLAEICKAKKEVGNSRMVFHPYEEELRAIRAEWQAPETRELYKKRSQGERLISEAVRRGARKAMALGAELSAIASSCDRDGQQSCVTCSRAGRTRISRSMLRFSWIEPRTATRS